MKLRARHPIAALGAFAISIGLSACSSEEDKIREGLLSAARHIQGRNDEPMAERAARLRSELSTALAPEVEIEGEAVASQRLTKPELLELLSLGFEPPATVIQLSDLDVRLGAGDRSAVAKGTALASSSQPGDLHGLQTKFTLDLEHQQGAWRVVRVWLSKARQELPEARP